MTMAGVLQGEGTTSTGGLGRLNILLAAQTRSLQPCFGLLPVSRWSHDKDFLEAGAAGGALSHLNTIKHKYLFSRNLPYKCGITNMGLTENITFGSTKKIACSHVHIFEQLRDDF